MLSDEPPGVPDKRDGLIVELRQVLEVLVSAVGGEGEHGFIAVVKVGEKRIRPWQLVSRARYNTQSACCCRCLPRLYSLTLASRANRLCGGQRQSIVPSASSGRNEVTHL